MPVTVYVDYDYKGKTATLKPGRHQVDPSLNDSISSVRVPAGWTVTLYEHTDFSGEKAVLTADTARVPAALQDKASAILIEEAAKAGSDESDDDGTSILSAENGDNWFYFEDQSDGS
ncbi:peptidase inhibitor family I36 protein [Kitasatospora sp. NPDC058201]|uniref:peptidase inhibitor family I36 protein n=1 Tax=unclassified Kitasatospora TaxID=2633591 RepID=UPI00365E446A